MALYHKRDVLNDFAYVLQFFSLISDNLGSVLFLKENCNVSPNFCSRQFYTSEMGWKSHKRLVNFIEDIHPRWIGHMDEENWSNLRNAMLRFIAPLLLIAVCTVALKILGLWNWSSQYRNKERIQSALNMGNRCTLYRVSHIEMWRSKWFWGAERSIILLIFFEGLFRSSGHLTFDPYISYKCQRLASTAFKRKGPNITEKLDL